MNFILRDIKRLSFNSISHFVTGKEVRVPIWYPQSRGAKICLKHLKTADMTGLNDSIFLLFLAFYWQLHPPYLFLQIFLDIWDKRLRSTDLELFCKIRKIVSFRIRYFEYIPKHYAKEAKRLSPNFASNTMQNQANLSSNICS